MQTIFNVLPTRWRQKPAGIDKKWNYVTVTLCIRPHRMPRIRCGLLLRMSCRSVVSLRVIRAVWQTPKSRIRLVNNDDWNYFSVRDSDVNKATSVKVKATATCCRSTAGARQRTTDDSTFTKLSSTCNLTNNGEQSLNCCSTMDNHS